MATGRFRRGWQLAGHSYRVLAGNRSLARFPILSLAVGNVGAIVFFGPGAIIYVSDAQEPVLIIFGVLTLYLLILVTLFFDTALAITASRVLTGETATTREGLDEARDRLGPIAGWALRQARADAATALVVPVIAIEGLGRRDACRRSAELVRERWGESAQRVVSINAPIALVTVPLLVVLFGLGLALADSSPPVAGLLLGLAGVVFVTAVVVGSTLTTVFRVALYRHATTAETLKEFDEVELESAFSPSSGTAAPTSQPAGQ